MISLLLAAAINSCPVVKMENKTKFPWNDFDKASLRKAQDHCGTIYPSSPCVKLFRKYGERDYSVLCGRKTSK